MSQGVLAKAAWRRDDELEADWPGSSPTVPGAGHQIPMRGESITRQQAYRERGVLSERASVEAPALEQVASGGSLDCDLRYGGLDRLWAAAMGYENPDTDAASGSPHNLTGSEYQHVYEAHKLLRNEEWSSGDRAATTGTAGQPGHWLSTHRKQSRGGLYLHKDYSTWRMWPAMVNGFQVSVTPGDASVSFDMMGRQLEAGVTGGEASWTFYGDEDLDNDPGLRPVQLYHLSANMALAAGSSWLNEDLAVSDLNINLNNNLKGDTYAANSQYLLEPWRNGMREVTGSFTLVRYLDDLWNTYLASDIRLQLLFDFQGASLGTNQARLSFYLPEVVITRSDAPVAGPEVITQNVEFMAYMPSQAPTALVTGAGGFLENIATRFDTELVIGTTNTYDENVYEND